jgi:hypothetical protein
MLTNAVLTTRTVSADGPPSRTMLSTLLGGPAAATTWIEIEKLVEPEALLAVTV